VVLREETDIDASESTIWRMMRAISPINKRVRRVPLAATRARAKSRPRGARRTSNLISGANSFA
jgi:hypothetical protein